MNPYIALAVIWVGTIVILLIIVKTASKSKVGYQDESGFHYGEPMPKA